MRVPIFVFNNRRYDVRVLKEAKTLVGVKLPVVSGDLDAGQPGHRLAQGATEG